jgi:TPR repeat protein
MATHTTRLALTWSLSLMWLLYLQAAHAQTPNYAQAQQALQSGQLTAAFTAFQTLAKQGDAASQFQLSLLYRTGRGVAPSAQQSMQWLLRSARSGYGAALSNLGGEYAKGQWVKQDNVKALALFLLAQANGLDVANSNAQTVARTLDPAQVEQAKALAQGCLQGSMQPCL